MRCEIARDTFSRALAIVAGAAGKTDLLPITTHVLLSAADDGLAVHATNLELSIKVSAPSRVSAPGATTTPSKKLAELVRAMVGASIWLHLDGERLVITDGKMKATLVTLPAVEFPDPWSTPNEEPERALVVSAAALVAAIDGTRYAVASDAKRGAIAGVQCAVRDGRLRLVALDGTRMAMAETPAAEKVATDGQGNIEVILTREACDAIRRSVDGLDADVELHVAGRRVMARVPSVAILASALHGPYPDISPVVARAVPKVTARMSRAAILASIKRVSIVDHQIKLVPEAGGITLLASSADLGTTEDRVDAVVTGDAMTIEVNGRFVTDALEAMTDAEEIEIGFGAADMPIRVTATKSAIDGVALIMPLRDKVTPTPIKPAA